MIAAFTLGKGAGEFVVDTTQAEAATGRIAQNLNLPGKTLSEWQQVMGNVGGTAEDANSSLLGLQGTMMNAELGNLDAQRTMNILGIDPMHENVAQAMISASQFFSTHSGAQNQVFAAQAGITTAMMNLLKQGPAAVEKQLNQTSATAMTDGQIAGATALQTAWAALLRTLDSVGRKLLADVNPYLLRLVGYLQQFATWANSNPWQAAIVGLGALSAAFVVVKGALAALVDYLIGPFLRRLLGVEAAAAAGGGAAGGAAAAAAEGEAAAAAGGVGLLPLAAIAGAGFLLTEGGEPGIQSGTEEEHELEQFVPGSMSNYDNATSSANLATARGFFEKNGWSPEQTAGILANMTAESGIDPTKVGDHGTSVGLMQWHNDRAIEMIDWAKSQGMNPKSLQAQLAFVQYDLTQGSHKAIGDALKQTQGASQSGVIVSQQYERPAAGDAEAYRRGQLAASILANTVSTAAPAPRPPAPAAAPLHPKLVSLLQQLKPPPPIPNAGKVQSPTSGQWHSIASAAAAASHGNTTTNTGAVNSHNTSSNETHVHIGAVHTQAKDANGITKSLASAIQRNGYSLFNANTGLA